MEVAGYSVLFFCVHVGVALKLLQLLQHFEHLPSPVSYIVSSMVKTRSFKPIVVNILREIGSKDPTDLVMDSGGTKSLASFLVGLSGEVPGAVLPLVSALLPHLSGESVTFRNGVLGVLGEVLRLLPCMEVGHTEEGAMSPQARDEMLQELINHIHDTHAFVRVKVLHILLQLCLIQVSWLIYSKIVWWRVWSR